LTQLPGLPVLFFTFLKIGAVTFGGGFAMIPLIEREVCSRRRWVEKAELADLLAVSQSVPGAIAINTVTFLGMRLRGLPGALAAIAGMVLPSFVVILAIAAALYRYINLPVIANAFGGIRAAVVALIAYAVLPIAKAGIKDGPTVVAAILGFLAVVFFNLHAAIAIALGGVFGAFRYLLTLRRLAGRRSAEDGKAAGE
jgi:chromate transporter